MRCGFAISEDLERWRGRPPVEPVIGAVPRVRGTVITGTSISAFGRIRLQSLKPVDLQTFDATKHDHPGDRAAQLRRITFHGSRHTSAALLLPAGIPVKVVSERLGHAKITITLDTYAHVLPSMGRHAADQLGALLHG
ncbi:MAG TPA: tyrosine-type recombinase/integrase [Vicinamibacterales bacterium]|nr:tyrosine-type recombinase/integrase [Vicinamibacterales bacterium]